MSKNKVDFSKGIYDARQLGTPRMLLLGFPYATMVGTLIGFTALIPVAGAYIGAGVGAFMIFTASPVKALLFLLFIAVLQQLEGNLIYPRVVGASIGLPGVWVLAAVTIGGVSLDDNAKTATVDGDTVNLTPLEYDILRLLMQHPGKVFSPHEIYRRVWHEDPAADNPVAVHVRHIREKIEINPAEPRYLKVVWGKGYKMEGAAQ